MLAQKLNGLGSRKPKVGNRVGFVAGEALSHPRVSSQAVAAMGSVPERDGHLILAIGFDQEGWHRGSKPPAPSWVWGFSYCKELGG